MNRGGAGSKVGKGVGNNRKARAPAAGRSTTFEQSERGGVAAVERALTVLDALYEAGGETTLAELAERTGLYKSTILRLIISLEAFRYIRRLESGEYHLGPKLFELGGAYQKSFRLETHVIPILRDIVAETTESASFYIRSRNHRIVLFRVDSDHHTVRDNVRPGDKLPLDRGAGGHILVRFAEGDRAASDLRPSDFVVATFGERQADTAAVAAPVFGPSGSLVGALGVSGPRTRFTPTTVKMMERVVLDKAIVLTDRLGGPVEIFPRQRALAAKLARRT